METRQAAPRRARCLHLLSRQAFDQKYGARAKLDEEAKFTELGEALSWFERHRKA